MNKHLDEKGQVLVFIVLAIVVIFGFSALAVDFGRVFSERRRAQNAADAAAYAAAYAGAKSQDWKAAGIASSQINGYNDTDAAENSGALTDVRIFRPPVRGKYSVASETINPNEYYQVIIRTRVEKIFSQFVYGDDLWVEVEAVTHATAQVGFASGAAIVATCEDCCNAVKFHGDGEIIVEKGGVVSKADKDGCPSVWRTGGAVLKITGGSVVAAGAWDGGNKDVCTIKDPKTKKNVEVPCVTVDSIIQNNPVPQTYYYPHVPSCSFPASQIYDTAGKPYKAKGETTISPGYYKGGIQVTSKDTILRLSPGMYCLEGDFDVPSGSVIGSNVMIYMKSGSVSINTKDPVRLSAPTETANCIKDDAVQLGFCWSGFLFYMPKNNTGTIFMAGGGSTTYTGTIYAIGDVSGGKPKCKFEGNTEEDMTLDTSIICHTVDVGGTNGLSIKYNAKLNVQSPGSIELTE